MYLFKILREFSLVVNINKELLADKNDRFIYFTKN